MNSIRGHGRRHFLATTAAAAFAGSLSAEPKRETCGLGIGTYGLQALKIADAIKLIADTGFNTIDLFVAQNYNLDPASLTKPKRREIQQVLADSGLRLVALIADLRPSTVPTDQAAKTDELKRIIELATDLDAAHPPTVQATLGGSDWESSKVLFADVLGPWSDLCADANTKLAVKPHRGSAMSTPAQAVELFKQLDAPKSLRMVYDYSHYAFREAPMPIVETIETALLWTEIVAVKDTILVNGEARFALPGEGGNWDNAEIIQRFHAGGYRGDFSCEVSAQIWKGAPNYEPVAATKKCFENMVGAFERAGVERG